MNIDTTLGIPIIAATFIGVAAGGFPGLRMNRTTIALAGAVLLLALHVIPANQATAAIDPSVLALLFAAMVITAHLRLSGFFGWVGQFIAGHARSPRVLLVWIMLVSGLLAALFLNDTVVLVFTPMVLEVTRAVRRNPLPYLIGLAVAANIGSTATIIGNPQNMLIGLSSHISFGLFLRTLGPVALASLVLAWISLVWLYRAEFGRPWTAEPGALPVRMDRPLLLKSLAAVALMSAALLAGASAPLAAIVAAAALLVWGGIPLEDIFVEVNWALLVFFAALFVVTGALEYMAVMEPVIALTGPAMQSGVGPLAVAAAILSNLVSNVPAVLLLRPVIQHLADPNRAWLTLAMASTLAGNLTLFGSAANLIVAEVAGRQGVKLTFREYLKAGVPITCATLLAGILWLSVVA